MGESEREPIEFFERIKEKRDSFSSTQRRIAEYISANIDEVVFSSAASIAQTLETSEAAVVRFAQALGYSGYPDLKGELVRYYRETLTPGKKFENYFESFDGQDDFYSRIVEQEIEYLRKSESSIETSNFYRAVERIVEADHRFVYATGANAGLATYLSFRLNRFRLRTTPDTSAGRNIFERLPQFTKNDVIVSYSFYQPTVDHKVLMDFLHERDIPNILITDTPVPPMVHNADTLLFARRGPYSAFHSLVVPMAITNALILAVANRLGDAAIETLNELSSIRREYQYEGVLAATNGEKPHEPKDLS